MEKNTNKYFFLKQALKFPFVKFPENTTFHFGKEASLKKAWSVLELGDYDSAQGRASVLKQIFSSLDHEEKLEQLSIFRELIEGDHIFNTDFGVDISSLKEDELVDVLLSLTNCHIDTFWNGFNMKFQKSLDEVFVKAIEIKDSLCKVMETFENLFHEILIATGSNHMVSSEKMFLKLLKKNMFHFFSPFHLEALIASCEELVENENSLAVSLKEFKNLFVSIKSSLEKNFCKDRVFWEYEDSQTEGTQKRSAKVVTPQIEMFKKRAKIIGKESFAKNYEMNGKSDKNISAARKLCMEDTMFDGKKLEKVIIITWFCLKRKPRPLCFRKVN